MMTKSLLTTAVAALTAAFLMTGCGGKAPQKEVENAKAAVENAKVAGAERFAADQLKAAQDALDAAVAEIQTQDGKKMMRNYGKAVSLLNSTVAAANIAKEAAVTNAVQAKIETKTLLTQVQASVAELKKLVKGNSKKIKDKASLKALDADIKEFEATLKTAGADMEADFIVASDKLKAMIEKVAGDKEKVTALTAAKTAKVAKKEEKKKKK
jgi:hypothetical protein